MTRLALPTSLLRTAGILLLCLMPGVALACALPPSVILLLPTGYYIAAAGVTVALTLLMVSYTTLDLWLLSTARTG